MDLSAVIFVAVAVAWAVYLVPKALHHHDEARRGRSVERFSHTVRVLARRDAVSARDARLVVPRRGQPDQRDHHAEPHETPAAPTAAQLRAGRLAARRATTRRRRVLGGLLFANLVVATLAVLGVVAAVWPAAPTGLLLGWLVACRVMVRGEHAAWGALTAPPAPVDHPETPAPRGSDAHAHEDADEADEADAVEEAVEEAVEPSAADTSSLEATPARSAMWDPVPVTLPTYVHKNTAIRRSVRTIDLDATGVWTSGRTDEDARIARATAKRVTRESGGDGERAVGS